MEMFFTPNRSGFCRGYGDNDAQGASIFTAAQSGSLTDVGTSVPGNDASYELCVWNGGPIGSGIRLRTSKAQSQGPPDRPAPERLSVSADTPCRSQTMAMPHLSGVDMGGSG